MHDARGGARDAVETWGGEEVLGREGGREGGGEECGGGAWVVCEGAGVGAFPVRGGEGGREGGKEGGMEGGRTSCLSSNEQSFCISHSPPSLPPSPPT